MLKVCMGSTMKYLETIYQSNKQQHKLIKLNFAYITDADELIDNSLRGYALVLPFIH